MVSQHHSAAEFLRLFQIAWPSRRMWETAARDGLTATQHDGLRSIADDFGEDFAEEKSLLMEEIRRIATTGADDPAYFEARIVATSAIP